MQKIPTVSKYYLLQFLWIDGDRQNSSAKMQKDLTVYQADGTLVKPFCIPIYTLTP